MTASNPYTSPVADASSANVAEPKKLTLGEIARETFLTWEKLRVIYLGVLVTFSLLMILLGDVRLLHSARMWIILIEGALIANVAYFAGPAVETYARWLGLQTKLLRVTLFILGTLLSTLLALLVVAALMFEELV